MDKILLILLTTKERKPILIEFSVYQGYPRIAHFDIT